MTTLENEMLKVMKHAQDLSERLDKNTRCDDYIKKITEEQKYREVLESQIKNLQVLNDQIEEKRV